VPVSRQLVKITDLNDKSTSCRSLAKKWLATKEVARNE
jgi:hypothetical protein